MCDFSFFILWLILFIDLFIMLFNILSREKFGIFRFNKIDLDNLSKKDKKLYVRRFRVKQQIRELNNELYYLNYKIKKIEGKDS